MVVHAVGARACDAARRGEGRGKRRREVPGGQYLEHGEASHTQNVGQGCHGEAAPRMLMRTFAAADAPASCVKGMALRKGCRRSEEPFQFVGRATNLTRRPALHATASHRKLAPEWCDQ
jgi:hypothetical protein